MAGTGAAKITKQSSIPTPLALRHLGKRSLVNPSLFSQIFSRHILINFSFYDCALSPNSCSEMHRWFGSPVLSSKNFPGVKSQISNQLLSQTELSPACLNCLPRSSQASSGKHLKDSAQLLSMIGWLWHQSMMLQCVESRTLNCLVQQMMVRQWQSRTKMLDSLGPMKMQEYLQSSMQTPALESKMKMVECSQSEIWNCCMLREAGILVWLSNHPFSNMKSSLFNLGFPNLPTPFCIIYYTSLTFTFAFKPFLIQLFLPIVQFKMYSMVFHIFFILFLISSTLELPCPPQCATCSSPTQCTTCNPHYYPTILAGLLSCEPCLQFCESCTSASVCDRCMDPYVLSGGHCQECEIFYATACKSIVSASSCESEYYVSDNYCYPCLLNCQQCTSSSDCKSCIPSYYLNSSVLTCNPCPTHCLTCDQYSPTRCFSCAEGYSLSFTYTCDAVTCSIAYCDYCSANGVCGKCKSMYYWDAGSGLCKEGASVVCQFGANGVFPNSCMNQCGEYYQEIENGSGGFWCVPLREARISEGSVSHQYEQKYFYLYNSLSQFLSGFSSSSSASSLTLESTGQYSLMIDSSTPTSLSLPLSSYYRLQISLKYKSTSSVALTLHATTESQTQSESTTFPSHSTPTATSYTTSYLHSNNLQVVLSSPQPIYLVEMLVRAKKCPTDCYRCLNDELCQMCNEPQYVSSYKCVDNCTIYYHMVSNRSCLSACPDFYYPSIISENDKYCEPCVSPCLECIDAAKCLTCISSMYLYQYQCLASCPAGYYAALSSGECEPCISPCKECTSAPNCLSCDEGYWDSASNQCTNQCPASTYGDNSTKQCKPCQSPCVTCRDSASKCLTCISSYYFHESRCLQTCPSRYYPSTSLPLSCNQCIPPCLLCTSSTSCLSCSYNYLLSTSCVSQCPQLYYKNIATRACQQCDSDCLTCEMQGICSACQVGKCFLEGACVDACPNGEYYQVETLVANTTVCSCQECTYPCQTCLSATSCLSCLQGYHYSLNNSCLSQCPSSYFPNGTSFQCQECSTKYGSECLECNKSGCSRCNTPYILHNAECLSECPMYHYSSSEMCHKCVAPCLTCLTFSECLTCVEPYILNDGSCMIQCPFGQVSIVQNSSSICQSCASPCLSCSSAVDNCTMCVYGYFLYQNQCYLNCSALTPLTTFYNEPITSTCTSCMFPCHTCLSQSHCLTCQIGYLTPQHKCQACPYGTYVNNLTNVCLQCPSQCLACYSHQYCTACAENYFLFNYTCISDTSVCIDNGYYAIGRKCQLCSMPCAKCNITKNNCLECLNGYILYGGNKCITDCPKGTYRSTNISTMVSVCLSCDASCISCTTDSGYCFSCDSGYLHVPASMTCVSACPSSTYEQGNSTCLPCRYPCLTCTSETSCQSCITGTLISNQCLTSCLEGQFSNSNNICETCSSPCKECENTSLSCTQCLQGYYLHGSTCLAVCPQLYFAQFEARQCLECLGLCEECNSHINCTTCADGLIYYYNIGKDYGQCVGECPVQYYNSTDSNGTQVCALCRADCLTCLDDSSCTLCLNNNPQYLGQCQEECPSQMYVSSGICQDCSEPCFNCTDAFTCTSCMNDSFLLVGSAQCIVGDTCPAGYYLIPGTRLCNGDCPDGFYHRNDRTCNDSGCGLDEYKGADMFCYAQCPEGFIANQEYECEKCEGDKCENGLFYDITTQIKREHLYVYLIFKEDPVYSSGVTSPDLSLNPAIDKTIYLFEDSRRRLLQTSATSSVRNITIELFPQKSLTETTMKLIFNQALATYINPLQRPSKTFFLQGYDLYPSLPTINIGLLALACAVVGLVKYPYMVDFGQLIFLLSLINLHYPQHLSSGLESTALAHLNGMIAVEQGIQSAGSGKFSYVTNMGLLSNCTSNYLLMAALLVLCGITFLIYRIAARNSHYNRVIDQDPYLSNENQNQDNPHHDNHDNVEVPGDSSSQSKSEEEKKNEKKRSCVRFMKNNFCHNFITAYLSRIFYFNYLPLALFVFCQLSIGTGGGTIGTIAFALACLTLIGIIIFPIVMFRVRKSKYTFLMVRKGILALALILSVDNPTYVIGVGAVVSLTTALLVGSYKIEKWAPQTRFIVFMQVLQFLLIVLLAIFAMIGEGYSTESRIKIGWGIIFLIIGIASLYILFAVFQLVLFTCKKCRNVDYKEEWAKNEESQTNGKDSQENTNQDLKDNESKKQDVSSKSIKIQKLLNVGAAKDLKSNQPIINNNLFWTYNEDDDDEQDKDKETEKDKAPEMLIRCVNEFSDFDPNERKRREEAASNEQEQQQEEQEESSDRER